MVSAVCVDNGEPTLERCVKSLRDQPVKVEVIIAAGPRTNMEIARSIADKVVGPIDFIGLARLEGVKTASSDFIISCDSDSIYGEGYVQYALEDLQRFNAVKAGTILPLDPSIDGYVESLFSRLIPYESGIGFRRQALYDILRVFPFTPFNRRADIGWHVLLLNPRIDPRMVVWTRMPTTGFRQLSVTLPRIIAIASAVGIPLGLIFRL